MSHKETTDGVLKSPFYCRLMLARTTIADRFIASLQAGSYGLLHTLGKGIGNPTLRGDEMTAYMDHKNLANEVIDAARAQEITDGVHRVLDRVATAEAQAEVVAGGAVAGDADGTHIPFHLIGQLQSNKIGKVLPVVNTIESVDSVDLAEKISRRAVARGITVGVLLEVNESGEASKSGCDPAHAIRIAQKIGTLDGLELQGLMTIGAHVDDETTIRKCFAHLRKTRDLILASKTPGTERCLELSMGMTGDMELAIAEGSTIVRVGTAIFGERAFI